MSVIDRGGLLVVTKPPENMQKNWVMCKYSSNLCYSFKLKSRDFEATAVIENSSKIVCHPGSA